MLENIIFYLKNMVKSKIFPMICVYAILFSIIAGRMFFLQIVNADELENKAETAQIKPREIKSPRGNIYDCKGKLLATNEQTYAITIEDTGDVKESDEMNKIIYNCINIIEKNGNKLDLEFAITIDKKGKYKFTLEESGVRRFKRDIFFKKSGEELTPEQEKMTAKDVFEYLRSKPDNMPKDGKVKFGYSLTKFNIGENYSNSEALKIMAVRSAIIVNRYQKYLPITLSTNVNEKTVAAIKESSAELPGVEVAEELRRVYYSSEYFAHIIGYTGLISSDMLAQLQDDESTKTIYNATDQIGKTGIELSLEETLRGRKGSEKLVIDEAYRVTEVKNKVDAIVGNDVHLSIDMDLQVSLYKILEKKIAGILISKLNNNMDSGTKGKSAAGIRVPIYDVYNAIIQNNVVNIEYFSKKEASSLEKSIYNKYKNAKNSTNKKIKSQLTYSNTKSGDQISESMQDYLKYVYSLLSSKEMIKLTNTDKLDKKYTDYLNGKCSLSKFLQYAISQNWVNLDMLNIGNDYYSTEEIYVKLVKYIFDILNDDLDYDKLIYKNLIYNYNLSGSEICLLLFEQKVLKKNKNDINGLKSGSSPFEFIKRKIKSLEIKPGQLGLEPCSGSIVVTDVNTGKVKALVSYPSYDNNMFANSVDSDYFYSINSNKAAPLLNRATQQKTAPGSTYKMLVASAALEEGVINPFSTVFDKLKFDKIIQPPKCWSKRSHGMINVSQALRDSCNYFFYEMGYRLGDGRGDNVNNEKGLKKLSKYAKLYGLSETSGIELSESDPTISDMDAVRSAIGQGTNSYTPIQLSKYVTTVANKGTCYDLTIIDKIKDVTTKTTNKKTAKVKNNISFASSTWNAISLGMRHVVKDGSIRQLFNKLPVAVAGKTGTAQENALKPNHALFVSYAPYDNPEISVTTVIANGYTSSNAAEIASDVYQYYFDKKSRKKLLDQKVSKPKLDTQIMD